MKKEFGAALELRGTHLENRIYDNLAECIKFERMRCTRRIGKTSIEALSFR